MENYLALTRDVLARGAHRPNRTSTPTGAGVFGGELTYDLQECFPLLAAKYVPFTSVIGELVGFVLGVTSAADFRQLGTKIWDENANDNESWLTNPHRDGDDHLGPIYGYQWRRYESVKLLRTADPNYAKRRNGYLKSGYEALGTLTYDGGGLAVFRKEIDQLQQMISRIQSDPYDRGHVVTAWNPGVMDEIALRACHTMFQCYVRGDFIDMKMYQRSADLFLGVPFNIASYAALTHVIAAATGKQPGKLTLTFGDLHIYENHIPQVMEMLRREPKPNTARLQVRTPIRLLDSLSPSDFILTGYDAHPAIRAKMANN